MIPLIINLTDTINNIINSHQLYDEICTTDLGNSNSYLVNVNFLNDDNHHNTDYNNQTSTYKQQLISNAEQLIDTIPLKDLTAYISANKASDSPLHLAASNNIQPLIKKFLSNGISINLQSLEGETAIMSAVKENNLEAVKYLYINGSNINICDSLGISPLIQATLYGSSNIVEYLCENGADLNLKYKNQYSAFIFAIDNILELSQRMKDYKSTLVETSSVNNVEEIDDEDYNMFCNDLANSCQILAYLGHKMDITNELLLQEINLFTNSFKYLYTHNKEEITEEINDNIDFFTCLIQSASEQQLSNTAKILGASSYEDVDE